MTALKKLATITAFYLIAIIFSLKIVAQTADYKPPYFEDADRVKKIAATLPAIEQLFKEHAEKNHFPAMVFGIVADGKLIYSGSYGYTNIEKKIAATPAYAFRIASMSKSFTTLAITKLRDEGKINLDDPASKYIPQMKKVKYLSTDAPPITVRNLMTHSAGFPEDNPWGDRQLADTDKELLQLIENGVQFSNVPGVVYEYSNLGFALLGQIITNVSGKPYQQYINEEILKPLGMNNTYWEYTKVPANKLAHGYRWQNGKWLEEELLHDGSYGAMGGLITSIEDFAKYMALHMEAWPARSDAESKVLKRSSLREMHYPWNFTGMNANYRLPNGKTCAISNAYAYGLGWTRDCEGRTWVGHSGGLPGFGSQWRFFEEYGIGVVSFANLTYAGTGTINLKVLDTIVKMAELKPRKLPASDILIQRKSELEKILPGWNNAEASGLFAENFFPDNPIDLLKKKTADIFTNAGKIINIGPIIPENNLRGSFIMEGEKKDIHIYFTLTPEPKPLIQEFRIVEREKKK